MPEACHALTAQASVLFPHKHRSAEGECSVAQQNVYDDDSFFQQFRDSRSSDVNFNDCIETPILTAMLPDLRGKHVLDVGCGMGQHAKQYADMGAASVLGIDISRRMLEHAVAHNGGDGIEYRLMPMEDLDKLDGQFDVVTSSLVFDYAEDFPALMRSIHRLLRDDGVFVFSMSHPMATAWDGTYDRYTRTDAGERLYANISNYMVEGRREVRWVVDAYEVYHRTVSSLLNAMIGAGFIIEECRESRIDDDMRLRYPAEFGGTLHRPDFIFFRCTKRREAC